MTLIPPPQYDFPPTIPVIERIMGWDEVSAFCAPLAGRALIPGEHINGCSSIASNGVCYIWRLDDRFVARHERAHCNGWPGNHPGGYGR